ncbi:repeat-containing protein [Seminavis robusta]|uniref:Repeat-containing protein n=1 Tax=Seminavis robusta TaxID=568900 RepID=A0A9N8H210_9STRA|nr:repeat-containing protein [Seminavis robusta]|eukprot:Sro2_g001710.1 repeat-containing protein (312) ;mRNA; f:230948-231883
MKASGILQCLALVLVVSTTWSFVPAVPRRSKSNPLYVLKDPLRSDNNQEDSEESIEEIRKKLLEQNVDSTTKVLGKNSTLQDWRDQLQQGTPPLTSVGRERLLVEMELLQALDCDEEKDEEKAIRNLWYYWYNERGRSNTATLMAADQLVHLGTQEGRKEAEAMYRQLIVEEGLNWAEPLNRLATLYFYQGRYAEAKDLCQMVLTIKPWQFGTATGIVTVCEKMQDTHGVNYWSTRRMPPLSENHGNARKEWVKKMTQQGSSMLGRGEKVLQKAFQSADDDSTTSGSVISDDDDDADENDRDITSDDGSWE